MKNFSRTLFLLLTLLSVCSLETFGCKVIRLTCNGRINPLCIENNIPVFSWNISGSRRGVMQYAYQIIVADSPEYIRKDYGNVWDSGKVLSGESIHISYSGDTPLSTETTYYWKVKIWNEEGEDSCWSETATFHIGLLSAEEWNEAQWIALHAMPEDGFLFPGTTSASGSSTLSFLSEAENELPRFRKTINLEKEIISARAYISGLGHFELFANGKKIGDNFLDPAWSDYRKSVYYVGFDITEELKKGENVIGVQLGNGFYHIPRTKERYHKLQVSYGLPKMICKIKITYTDGTKAEINSDHDWKVTDGPIVFSSIYGGEDFDARKEIKEWSQPGCDDTGWKVPQIVSQTGKLTPQLSPSLQIKQQLPPLTVTRIAPSVYLYDFGQNASAIPFIKIKGKRGSKIVIRPGEFLTADGEVDQSNSGKPNWFSYVLSGEETEEWQPSFSYYGFRYLQVEGVVPEYEPNPDDLPEVVSLESLHVTSSAEPVGTFSCSNELFNQIYALIDWSVRSNMVSVMTDCPHREKLGWLEVTHLMGNSIAYCYDIRKLYHKILADMRNSQLENGLIPSIAPEFAVFEGGFRDSPEWGSAGVILPWFLYQWYGDRSVLEENYELMKRYADYLTSKSESYIVYHGLGDWYDLGPEHPGYSQLTTRGLTSTAIYYYDLMILAQVSQLMGKAEDQPYYTGLAANVKKAFNEMFFDEENGYYDKGSQTANAMPLYLGLVEPQFKESVKQQIIKDIRENGNSITSGDIGFRYLLRVLESENASDVIFDINNQVEKPGYGYQVRAGATSLTESWQALTTASHNHCMLGHLMEWFYSSLAGIRKAENSIAFKEIELSPEMPGDITHVSASFRSPYGVIQSNWKIEEELFMYDLEIPANTTAKVYLPVTDPEMIRESGRKIEEQEGIKLLPSEGKRCVLEIGSGNYSFTCPLLISDFR